MPAQASDRLPGAVPTVAITADLQTPVAAAAGAVIALDFADDLPVAQTRFAGRSSWRPAERRGRR